MHIQLTEDVIKKIDEMSRTSYWNAYLDRNLYAYILKGVSFPHPKELEEDAKDFQTSMSEHLYYYNDASSELCLVPRL